VKQFLKVNLVRYTTWIEDLMKQSCEALVGVD